MINTTEMDLDYLLAQAQCANVTKCFHLSEKRENIPEPRSLHFKRKSYAMGTVLVAY